MKFQTIMGSSDGTFYKAVFILGVTFTVGFVTGYKVLTIIRSSTTALIQNYFLGKRIKNGMVEKKKRKTCSKVAGDTERNRSNEGTLKHVIVNHGVKVEFFS